MTCRPDNLLRKTIMVGLLAAATGCTQIPELDMGLTPQLRAAKYPKLVPIEDALGPPLLPDTEAQDLQDELEARRDGLQTKAKGLQTPVLTDADRDRLNDEIGA